MCRFAAIYIIAYNVGMTSTAHAIVGGAIASRFANPILAIPIALASHYVMDSIPHWDFGTDWRNRPKQYTGAFAIAETLIGIGLSVLVFSSTVFIPYLLLIIVCSLLPDWLEAPWYIFFARSDKKGLSKNAGVIERLAYTFYKLPSVFHAKASFPFGIFTQIATVVFFLAILL